MPYCTEVKRRTFVPLQVDPLRTRPFGGKTGRTQGSTEPKAQVVNVWVKPDRVPSVRR